LLCGPTAQQSGAGRRGFPRRVRQPDPRTIMERTIPFFRKIVPEENKTAIPNNVLDGQTSVP
jgi:hypothetical protein